METAVNEILECFIINLEEDSDLSSGDGFL